MTRRKKHQPPKQEALSAALSRLSPPQLKALHRIAKLPNRGCKPFFTPAYAMVALRSAAYPDTLR